MDVLTCDNLTEGAEEDLGGKASGLRRLVLAGFRVPDFFVIPTSVFSRHLGSKDVASAVTSAATSASAWATDSPDFVGHVTAISGPLRAAVETCELDSAFATSLQSAVAGLGKGPFAVRSSMVGEDSAATSFAGQLDTYLYVSPEDVAMCVRRCWASAFGQRALAYALRAGMRISDLRVAVVVQAMIDAQVSGVLFTVQPVTGQRDVSLLTAAWGLGEGVVSGMCDTDEYEWNALDGVRSVKIADKDVQVIRDPSGSGTVAVPTPEDRRALRCLDDENVERICKMGEQIAADMGMPADVEWSIVDGELYVLQARPVTNLPTQPAQPIQPIQLDGPEIVWDNSNIQESYCGVTTPLTFSFASYAYQTVYRQFARTFGVSDRVLGEMEPVVRNMLGLIDGRVYYNLNNWYRLILIFPFFARNKEDMEAMMGVEEPVDFVSDKDLSTSDRIRELGSLAGVGVRLGPRMARLDREVDRFCEHFDEVYRRINRNSLGSTSLWQLHETIRMLYQDLLDRWETPIVNDMRVMMASGRLRRLLEGAVGDDANSVYADLMGGIPGLESVEPTRRLLRLAHEARPDPAIVVALRTGTPQDSRQRIRDEHPVFSAQIDAFIEDYGDRCIGELKLETISLRQDPTFVIAVLRSYLDAPDLDPDELEQRDRTRYESARQRVAAALPARNRHMLSKRITAARKAVAAREKLRLLRTKAFGLARDIFCAMGVHLHEAGLLAEARDVFYLTTPELEAFIEGRGPGGSFAAIVEARKNEFAAYEDTEIPNRFTTTGSPYLDSSFRPTGTVVPSELDSDVLHGLGVCAGVVTSEVRVILRADEELSLNGKILCTIRTDPGWAPLFPTTSGLIVERGSTLSHSAVVARELGIPAVVGVRDVTRILQNGDLVRLDGSAGTVERFLGTAEP